MINKEKLNKLGQELKDIEIKMESIKQHKQRKGTYGHKISEAAKKEYKLLQDSKKEKLKELSLLIKAMTNKGENINGPSKRVDQEKTINNEVLERYIELLEQSQDKILKEYNETLKGAGITSPLSKKLTF